MLVYESSIKTELFNNHSKSSIYEFWFNNAQTVYILLCVCLCVCVCVCQHKLYTICILVCFYHSRCSSSRHCCCCHPREVLLHHQQHVYAAAALRVDTADTELILNLYRILLTLQTLLIWKYMNQQYIDCIFMLISVTVLYNKCLYYMNI